MVMDKLILTIATRATGALFTALISRGAWILTSTGTQILATMTAVAKTPTMPRSAKFWCGTGTVKNQDHITDIIYLVLIHLFLIYLNLIDSI